MTALLSRGRRRTSCGHEQTVVTVCFWVGRPSVGRPNVIEGKLHQYVVRTFAAR